MTKMSKKDVTSVLNLTIYAFFVKDFDIFMLLLSFGKLKKITFISNLIPKLKKQNKHFRVKCNEISRGKLQNLLPIYQVFNLMLESLDWIDKKLRFFRKFTKWWFLWNTFVIWNFPFIQSVYVTSGSLLYTKCCLKINIFQKVRFYKGIRFYKSTMIL